MQRELFSSLWTMSPSSECEKFFEEAFLAHSIQDLDLRLDIQTK